MSLDASRAAFLELYVALVQALWSRKGTQFPVLKHAFEKARKLHGEHLTRLMVDWHEQTKSLKQLVKDTDEGLFDQDSVPPCISVLCIDKIFADVNFSVASRANLWLYLQGLVLHAEHYATSQEEPANSECEIPAPAAPSKNQGAKSNDSGIPFGTGNEAQLKAVQELTKALPPQVMSKMHSLAQGYQNELTEGKCDVSDMSFSRILKDVVGALNTEDIMSFVSNIDGVIETMQKSQALPEVQALMRSMQKEQAGSTQEV